MATSSSILVDKTRLNFLIESRQDSLGKTCYFVSTSAGRFCFRQLSSILDFIELNKDLGYVI